MRISKCSLSDNIVKKHEYVSLALLVSEVNNHSNKTIQESWDLVEK